MKTTKCLLCNEEVNRNTAYETRHRYRTIVVTATAVKHPTGTRYVCADCLKRAIDRIEDRTADRHSTYYEENQKRVSKPTAQGYTISKEFEIGESFIQFDHEKICSAYANLLTRAFLPTHDCTVTSEWKSPIYNGLQSYSKIAKHLDTLVYLNEWNTDPSYGTHTNIGHTDFTASHMDILRQWHKTLLMPLSDYLESNSTQCIDIFSRDLSGTWAEPINPNNPLNHENFINFQHASWVEFRVNKYISYQQDSYATKVCIALFDHLLKFAKAVIANRTTYNGRVLADKNRECAEKTAQKLVKTFIEMHSAKMLNSTESVTA